MNVLVIDVGGTHVKALVSGQQEHRQFDSGSEFIPERVVSGVKKIAGDWHYGTISIGYPGPVLNNRPIAEPWNLGRGGSVSIFKPLGTCFKWKARRNAATCFKYRYNETKGLHKWEQ